MTDFARGPVTVRAPATSANLGPGFDSLALCLDLADVATVEVTASGTGVCIAGEGADNLARDDSHLVVATMREVFERWGLEQPGLRLDCANAIPQGRGLGSSAAAIGAGLRLAEAVAPTHTLSAGEALGLATALEGHPDNVAACLLGGLTIAWTDRGVPSATRLAVDPSVQPVVLLAPASLSTREARALLPASVTHRDASENAARAALLVAALTTDPGLLLPATSDRLHQDARRPAMGESLALVDVLRGRGVAAVISGAGPSVLALCVRRHLADVLDSVPAGWRALPVSVCSEGVSVVDRHAVGNAPA